MNEEQLKEMQRRRIEEKMRAAYIEEKKREILQKYMDSAAYDRVSNVRHANQEVYDKLVEVVVQLAGSGRLTRRLSEKEVVAILSKISERREPNIEIRRK